MAYNSVQELPNTLRSILPEAAQKMFMEVHNDSFGRLQDEATAMRVAWNVIKKRFKMADGQWVANSADFEMPARYIFESAMPVKQLIINSTESEIVIEAVLADTTPRKGDGKWFTEKSLMEIADQINTKGSTLPDVEHAVLEALKDRSMSSDVDRAVYTKEKGMFNQIKAAVKDGKLWIKAWLDKAFEKVVQTYKFLSIEAMAKGAEDGSLSDPEYLGFTFTEKPRLPNAQVVGL